MDAEDMEDDDEDEGNSAEQRAKRAADAGARPPIYNAEGMHEKLEDISWPSEVPEPSVITTLIHTSCQLGICFPLYLSI